MRRTGKGRRRNNRRGRTVQGQKLSRRAHAQRQVRAPRTAKQFFAMSKQAQDEYIKATSVASDARATRRSPRKIAKRLGIDFEKVLRLAWRAFRKRRNGRIVPLAVDRLLRVIVTATNKGLLEIPTRDSKLASLIGEHWNAVHKYLSTGASDLRRFEGIQVIDTKGRRANLLTDLAELDRQAGAGEFSFETIYAKR